jgi:hypothetical protein
MNKGIAGLITALVLALAVPSEATTDPVERYRDMTDKMEIVQIYDSANLTFEMLQNRKGKIIIEKVIGIMTDDNGNGRVLNCKNPEYDYISYKTVENAHIGDVIATYFVYNPDNNIEDDIIERFDLIID